MTDNINKIVILPGAEAASQRFANSYDLGQGFDKLFPGQDAYDFVYCCDGPAGWGPLAGRDLNDITALVMEVQGFNDEGDWTWRVELNDGSVHRLTGGCDYTGWGCQDWGDWS